jgi:hypothetical protein
MRRFEQAALKITGLAFAAALLSGCGVSMPSRRCQSLL